MISQEPLSRNVSIGSDDVRGRVRIALTSGENEITHFWATVSDDYEKIVLEHCLLESCLPASRRIVSEEGLNLIPAEETEELLTPDEFSQLLKRISDVGFEAQAPIHKTLSSIVRDYSLAYENAYNQQIPKLEVTELANGAKWLDITCALNGGKFNENQAWKLIEELLTKEELNEEELNRDDFELVSARGFIIDIDQKTFEFEGKIQRTKIYAFISGKMIVTLHQGHLDFRRKDEGKLCSLGIAKNSSSDASTGGEAWIQVLEELSEGYKEVLKVFDTKIDSLLTDYLSKLDEAPQTRLSKDNVALLGNTGRSLRYMKAKIEQALNQIESLTPNSKNTKLNSIFSQDEAGFSNSIDLIERVSGTLKARINTIEKIETSIHAIRDKDKDAQTLERENRSFLLTLTATFLVPPTLSAQISMIESFKNIQDQIFWGGILITIPLSIGFILYSRYRNRFQV